MDKPLALPVVPAIPAGTGQRRNRERNGGQPQLATALGLDLDRVQLLLAQAAISAATARIEVL